MKSRNHIVLSLFALVAVTGCASTKVTARQQLAKENIARLDHIWVYDFVATPADLPAGSDVAAQSAPQTAEQIATGRQLGAQIAKQLVADIQNMGTSRAGGHERNVATGRRHCDPRLSPLGRRGQCRQTRRARIRLRGIGVDHGGRRLSNDGPGAAQTRVRHCSIRRKQNARGALGAVVLVATGNPVGLIVSSGMKMYGEASGGSKVEGRAKQTAEEIANQLKIRFRQQGWIQ